LITLAEQKCWLSLPADVENNAPTAGVPENACPFRDVDPRCRIAWTTPVAMSPAAPLAGVTMMAVPNPSTATRAALAGVRESHRDRRRGRLGGADVGSSMSPRSER
jgi:hypothetical protein